LLGEFVDKQLSKHVGSRNRKGAWEFRGGSSGSSEWNKLFKKKITNLSADDDSLCVNLPDVLDLPNEYCVIQTTLKYKKNVLLRLKNHDDICERINRDLRTLFEDAVVNPKSSLDKYIAFNVEQSANENTGSRASKRKCDGDDDDVVEGHDDDDDDDVEDEQSANENTGSRASKKGKHERDGDGDDDDSHEGTVLAAGEGCELEDGQADDSGRDLEE